MLHGARYSLIVALLSLLPVVAWGGTLGLASGWVGGKLDALIMWAVNTALALPLLFFVLGLVPFPDGLVDTGKSPPTPDSRASGNDGQVKRVSGIRHIQVETVLVVVSGWSLLNTVQAVALILAPRFARVARDEALTLKLSGLGATTAAHWFNVLMVLLTLHIGLAILIEATLSFLGAGLPPPIPSLGSMDVNRVSAWWIFFSPAWRL